jgi:uncharacterized protein YkwD
MPAIRIQIRGQTFDAPLPPTAVRIGSAEDADLRLPPEGVAAEHCRLEPLADGRHVLRDASSGYETRVNGQAVKQVSLQDGDVIEVGDARITYLAQAPGAPAPEQEPEPIPAEPIPEEPAPVAPAAAPAAAQAAGPAPAKADAPPPPPPPPPSRPRAARAGAPRAEAAPRAPARAGAGTPSAPAGRRRRRVPVLGLLTGAVVLVGVLFALQHTGGRSDGSFDAIFHQAQQRFDAKDYDRARTLYRQVAEGTRDEHLRTRAQDGLELIAQVHQEIEGRLQGLEAEQLDLTPDGLARERRRFLAAYGDGQAAAFDALEARIATAQQEWKTVNLKATKAEAQGHVQDEAFTEARAVWRRFERAAPAAVDVSAEVKAALADLETQAGADADRLLQRCAIWNRNGQAQRGVRLLSDMLPRFEGLAAHARLEKGLAAARAAAAVPPPTRHEPTAPPPRPKAHPEGPAPTAPTVPKTPTDAAAAKARAEQAAQALAKAEPLAAHRGFREAAAQLAAAARALPAGPARARLEGRAEDYGLAARGLEALVAHIHAHPERYGSVRLSAHLVVTLLDADATNVEARVIGGTSKYAWSRLAADVFPRLVTRMRPGKEDCVPTSALLEGVGRHDEARRGLYRAVQEGVPEATVFPVLARWRGEEVPEGGYVAYEGRYVTPAEREVLVREAKIAAALKQLASTKEDVRRQGCEALLALGEPARDRFTAALRSRRAWLVDKLLHAKSYASAKYKARLLQLLDERRKNALALIYDAQAYPYPNPTHKNQKRVEELVDLVRQVWERPFELVAQWDKKLKAGLASISEVDEWLSRAEPGYRPDLADVRARIDKAIDVPGAADPDKRPYSLGVLAYNATLRTTATGQEKANVRSVNDYRMMMGLVALKIDERLVRAARGHSRHMAVNGYFAHDVPAPYATPENRTPSSRCSQQGFSGGVGENIARGPSTGHGAFLAWFGSSGHHRNMLGRGWLVMGCGRSHGTWWTQNFGGGSKSLKPPDPLPPPTPPFAPEPEDAKGRPLPQGG